MRIKSLALDHFRGVAGMELDFGGSSAAVMGANGTGKTTVANAITWLLCDAPFTGEKDFSPKTNGVHNGAHKAEMAVITADGEAVTIAKSFAEKWTKKRGAAKSELTGHTTEYSVDGVPKSKAEYERRVLELMGLASADQARMCLIHGHFAESMKPDDRRRVLCELAGDITPESVIASTPELAELPGILGKKSVADWQKVAAESRRKLNKEMDTLPAQIDEARRAIADARDEAAISADLAKAEAELAKVKASVATAASDPAAALRVKLAEEQARYQERVNKFNATLGANIAAVQGQKDAVDRELAADEAELRRAIAEAEGCEERLKRLRADFARVRGEAFAADEVCPTCKQPIPAERIEQARNKFAAGQQSRLDAINAEGKSIAAERLAPLKERIAALRGKVEAQSRESEKHALQIEGYRKQYAKAAPWEQTDICKELTAQIDAVAASGQPVTDATLSEAESRLSERLSALREELAKSRANAGQHKRVAELEAAQRAKGDELDGLDCGLALCDKYARAMAKAVSEGINAHFKTVRWQLFREQINGGLEQVCNPMTQNAAGTWVEWRASNTAAQINAGLEIAHVLGQHWGTELPVIIDRAESVSEPLKVPEQAIRLVVSPADKALRLEVEAE